MGGSLSPQERLAVRRRAVRQWQRGGCFRVAAVVVEQLADQDVTRDWLQTCRDVCDWWP
ncbi:hypothetical protein [Dactylosporangium sp. CA-139066]|uniref:hypothetical protein n=1 Tax=Dactylosporangium sp. CA-139066 TaxID=3239930 RepID=UPI003D8DA3D4